MQAYTHQMRADHCAIGWGVIGSAAQVKTLISPIIEGHDHTNYPTIQMRD